MSRLSRLLAVFAAAGIALTSCATAPGGSVGAGSGAAWGSMAPDAPSGEVRAQGTVMDTGDSVELCLGAIMESYPPQCRGIPLTNWTWDGIDGSESASGVQWGSYALQGTYDGESFTVTQPPIMLALYDAIPIPDAEPDESGTTDEETLLAIQRDVSEQLGDQAVMSIVHNGRLVVDVVWDDGTLQAAADDEFGDDVVVVRSLLHAVEG